MRFFLRLFRFASLIACAVLGTSVLMYTAPGYFSDQREMDAAHSEVALQDLAQLHATQASLHSLLRSQVLQFAHGDLGTSRQMNEPVTGLLKQSLGASLELVTKALTIAWLSALVLSIISSLPELRSFDTPIAVLTSLLLAVPVGALATFCLVANHEAPVLVLAAVIGIRDFKILQKSLQDIWGSPHLFHARAQGFSTSRLLAIHVFPPFSRELFSVGVMSLTLALSTLVPVEVVFDRRGIGKLAWNAAMNRDLPVLLATTALISACVGLTSFLNASLKRTSVDLCAQ